MADTRDPVDVLGDVLCRTSFGDFKEATLRQIAARLVGKLHAAGFRISREGPGRDPAVGWSVTEVVEDDGSWGITSTVLPGLVAGADTRAEAWALWPDAVESWASGANDARVEAERSLIGQVAPTSVGDGDG